MRNIMKLALAIFLISTVAACNNDEGNNNANETDQVVETPDQSGTNEGETDQQNQPNEDSTDQEGQEANENGDTASSNRPASKTEAIQIEGNDEIFTFSLVEVSQLGMSTYVIEDMDYEVVSSGEGDALIVYAAFGAVRNDEARFSLFSPSAEQHTSLEGLHASMSDILQENGFEVVNQTENFSVPWSTNEFFYRGLRDGVYLFGTVSTFEQNGRLYQILFQYPGEYGDGFLPRVYRLIKDIEWM